MRLKQFDIDPANVDRDGIAEAQQLVGAGNLTLNGALADLGTAGQFDIGDSYSSGVGGVQIGVYSAGNLTAVTFTITGKDQDGFAITEDVAGPNNDTTETTKYFSQVTQIAADGAVGSDVEVGTVDEVITKTIPVDRASNVACAMGVTVTGTINYTVQETLDPVQSTAEVQAAQWHNLSALASKTASLLSVGTVGVNAIRLMVNSYTDTAEIQLDISQPVRS